MNRTFTAMLVMLVVLLLAPPGRGQTYPAAKRDWVKYPAIKSVKTPPTLYAVGDVHGDYDQLAKMLVTAGILDQIPSSPTAPHWSAGKCVLVCTGDLINKHTQSISVITLMRSLQSQAAAAGGDVVVTLGNHEANFLAMDSAKRQATDFSKELTQAGMSPEDVACGRDAQGIGLWLRNLPAGAKVGDWFLCHAGNTGGMTIPELETKIEAQVSAYGWAAPILSDPNSMLEARMSPRPWWYRADAKTGADSEGRDR